MPYRERVARLSLVDAAGGSEIIAAALFLSAVAEAVHYGVAALSYRRQS